MKRQRANLCLVELMLPIPLWRPTKVVVIPLTSAPAQPAKLWGMGRPNVALITHDTPSGYWTANGINVVLSFNIATWNEAQVVCPANTSVCTQNEVAAACPVPAGSYPVYLCDGTTLMIPQKVIRR
jgi:hypothetical protein